MLWGGGGATADMIREAIRPRHPLKDSSVRTILRRLEAQGHVRHRLEGKVFVYEAAVRPRRLAATTVRQVIERFCSGSVEKFLLGMVDEQVLSADELQRLARKIGSRK